MDKAYKEAFAKLNDEQKKAVTQINGPLLVVAGPGTGKTELLALRAAQILRQDDTVLPSNILCLTFTDNAADNMRQRLTRYIGQDAYQVAIHTFNSFGQYVMNAFPEYFYEWRDMQTADELTTHRILEDILGRLPGDHALTARGSDGVFYSLRQLKNFISDAKKNNLLPDDIQSIIQTNLRAYELFTPLIQKYWPQTMVGKEALTAIIKFAEAAADVKVEASPVEGLVSEAELIIESLAQAARESETMSKGQTKPFTAWKNAWLKKDDNKAWVFASAEHAPKLIAAADIYKQYRESLDSLGLADFNDQIMWVLRTMQAKPELRYNLQERFLYVMIDEFQDTNRAQLLMSRFITDASEHERKPNIMVVGDDDQAIFRFQGADIGNVAEFEERYEHGEPVVLVKNYRSSQEILDISRLVSRQIAVSVEKQRDITKNLIAAEKKQGTGVKLVEFTHQSEHYGWVAGQIDRLRAKVSGKEIAVLARERSQLDELVPYLRALKIPIDYERRESVLEQNHIVSLLNMARLVSALAHKQPAKANDLLPAILSEPMWQIETVDIWQLSQTALSEKKLWIEVMLKNTNPKISQVARFLVKLGNLSGSLPAEQVLDKLIGTSPLDDFTSPFKEYFFGEEILKNQPANYLTLLSHLATLRRHLRKYQGNQNKPVNLAELIDFANAYERTETLKMLDRSPHREDPNAVRLMTVHKAKGLEFNNVYVIGLVQSSWAKSGRSNRFSYPENLKIIKPSDNDSDDSLRLLFVAMTRARHSLDLCYYLSNEDGRAEQPYAPLLALNQAPKRPQLKVDAATLSEQYEQRWLKRHASISTKDMRTYLSEPLARYKLSPTHFNDFLDVSLGGPLYFLTEHILKFPSSRPPHASYGSAVHAALSLAHNQVAQAGKLDSKKVLKKFDEVLRTHPLSTRELQQFGKEGRETITYYLAKQATDFEPDQKVDVGLEVSLSSGAKLRGNIDRLDMDSSNKVIQITDYKTGAPKASWQLPRSAENYDRIKMHRYRNQLLFYKILVDASSDYGQRGWHAESGALRFVKKNASGKLVTLPLVFERDEVDRMVRLIERVWSHIQKLEWPDSSQFKPNLEGVLEFEAHLLSGK